MVTQGHAGAIDHAREHASLGLLFMLGPQLLVTAEGQHRSGGHRSRHEQIHRLRRERRHQGTAKDRTQSECDVAVQDHQAVQALTPRKRGHQVSRISVRAGIEKAARKTKGERGDHQRDLRNGRKTDSETHHRGERADDDRGLARTDRIDYRTRGEIPNRRSEIAHERDGRHQKSRARQIVGCRSDQAQKIHRVVRAPLKALDADEAPLGGAEPALVMGSSAHVPTSQTKIRAAQTAAMKRTRGQRHHRPRVYLFPSPEGFRTAEDTVPKNSPGRHNSRTRLPRPRRRTGR